jgi:hypothetical protein
MVVYIHPFGTELYEKTWHDTGLWSTMNISSYEQLIPVHIQHKFSPNNVASKGI